MFAVIPRLLRENGCWHSRTGAKDRRPELDRLMADAHKRRFDVVTVWKFDRFARHVPSVAVISKPAISAFSSKLRMPECLA
jgi:DNA invertase Pin-like site-specific DNA recombinase